MRFFLFLLLIPLFAYCGNDDINLDGIRFESTERIRTRIGETIQLRLEEVPKNFNGTFCWRIDGREFSTEQNPELTFERYGTGMITVTLKSGAQSRTLTRHYFSAKVAEHQVVMYIPSWQPYRAQPWDKMTHLILCFGTINSNGSVNVADVRRVLTPAIREAQNHGVQVLLAIGGGDALTEPGGVDYYGFTNAKRNPVTRALAIQNLVNLVDEMNLCGIDVDYEHWDKSGVFNPDNAVRAHYLEIFVRELREALSERYLLTAAISQFMLQRGFFPETMHRHLDLVNLMIYDFRGPWNPNDIGPHSHWEFFTSFISQAQRAGIPDHKIIPGVPFYGVRFWTDNHGIRRAEHIVYREIVRRDPAAAQVEHRWDFGADFGVVYFDGLPMIRRKTEFIMAQNLGGIMAWEITQDAPFTSDLSLLRAIDEIIGTSR